MGAQPLGSVFGVRELVRTGDLYYSTTQVMIAHSTFDTYFGLPGAPVQQHLPELRPRRSWVRRLVCCYFWRLMSATAFVSDCLPSVKCMVAVTVAVAALLVCTLHFFGTTLPPPQPPQPPHAPSIDNDSVGWFKEAPYTIRDVFEHLDDDEFRYHPSTLHMIVPSFDSLYPGADMHFTSQKTPCQQLLASAKSLEKKAYEKTSEVPPRPRLDRAGVDEDEPNLLGASFFICSSACSEGRGAPLPPRDELRPLL